MSLCKIDKDWDIQRRTLSDRLTLSSPLDSNRAYSQQTESNNEIYSTFGSWACHVLVPSGT